MNSQMTGVSFGLTCKTCDGTGVFPGPYKECPECSGRGYLPLGKTKEFTVDTESNPTHHHFGKVAEGVTLRGDISIEVFKSIRCKERSAEAVVKFYMSRGYDLVDSRSSERPGDRILDFRLHGETE